MIRRDEVTNLVNVVEITPGEPLQISVTKYVKRPDGKGRTITQRVPVIDPCLAERVLSEIGKGDEIHATIVTEWSKQGYRTYLSDFCAVAQVHVPTRTARPRSVPARK